MAAGSGNLYARLLVVIGALVILAAGGFYFIHQKRKPPSPLIQQLVPESDSPQTDYSHLVEKLRPLHQRLDPPKPGDWLSQYQEPGQTFSQYLALHHPHESHAMCIIPLGNFSEAQRRVLNLTAEYLGLFFNLPSRIVEPLSDAEIPNSARRNNPFTRQLQYLTAYILNDLLIPRRPPDCAAYLALTATDLWPGKGWNFVFGEATYDKGVGVWSLARYGNPEGSQEELTTYRDRALGVGTHEAGHIFYFYHCTAYHCNMNGSNNLGEMDNTPFWLCPECQAKVWWLTNTDPIDHLNRLMKFSSDHQMAEETAYYQKVISILSIPTK